MDFFEGSTVEEMKEWIDEGNDPSACNGNNALYYAILYGCLDVIQYLMSEEITQKFPGIRLSCCSIQQACNSGHLEVVQYLLSDEIVQKFPDINPRVDDNYCIQYACYSGKYNIVKYLLSDSITKKFPGIDPSANNIEGLRHACKNGDLNIVKYLLEEQSHKFPKLRDILYDTELLKCLEKRKQYEIIEYLNNFKRKIDLNT